jgi:LCP family protein required for cell wall assembly
MPGDGFPPEGPRNGRRADETSAHLPADGFPPAGPRRGREASAHRPVPGEAAHPGDDPRNGRRPGEASAHHPMPGDGFPGDDTRLNGFPSEAPRGRRTENPGDGFPPEAPLRRTGAHDGFPEAPRGRRTENPGDGFPPDARRGRDPHHPAPGENAHPGDAFPRDDTPRNGRRPGEASAHHPVPGRFPDDPRRQGPPTPPPGQWPGEPLSEPRLTPAAIDAPDGRPLSSGVPPVPTPLPPRGGDDLVSMTTEMEAIGEEVQKRRTIDHTLARFSAVHDELKAEEREKKAKRRKLRPWQADDDEMDRLDEMDAQQSMAMRIPSVPDEDEDDEPEEDEKPTRRKKLRDKLRGRSAGKAFVVFFAALVFVSTATAWGFKSYVEAGAQTVDALDPDSQAIQDAEAQRGDENFLLVGSDTRSGAAAGDGVGDEKEVQGARSDTVMIAHIPRDRQRVVVVSFPRDLEVTRPACEGWDADTGELNGEQHQAEELVKLNTAYQVGGPKCVTKLVQELSGLAINHFVGIDFHGFKDMVDAVQGVEVCVERPMKDEILGTVVPQAGKNVKLTGDQALNFVRARHVEGDVTSDYGRITRQQRFLSSLLRKAMSSEVLLNPGKLTDFVDAFSGATFGDNIGVDQLFTLGQSMQGVVAGRVTFITVPTVGEANDRNNEELRAEDNAALFEAIRQDAPLPGEAPEKKPADDASKDTAKASTLAQDQPQGPVDPRTVKIQVLNGGNETGGIASDTADALAEQGFQIMRVDSAPEAIDKPAVVRFSKERAAEAQTVQAAVPGSVLQEDPSLAGAIMLVIGPGFDGEVVSPNGGGKPPEVPDNLSTVNAGDVSCA